MKELKDFFATPLGHIIGRVIVIVVILLVAIIVTQIINRLFSKAVNRLKDAKNPNAAVVAFLQYAALLVVDIISFFCIVATIPALNSILTSLLTSGGVLAIVWNVI